MNRDIVMIRQKTSELINSIEYAVRFFQEQNFDKALRKTTEIMACTSEFLNWIESGISREVRVNIPWNTEELLYALQDVLAAQEVKDYILLSDFLMLRLHPIFSNLQAAVVQIETEECFAEKYECNIKILEQSQPALAKQLRQAGVPGRVENNHVLEMTSSGEYTLRMDTDTGSYYMHTNNNPRQEGYQLAKAWYRDEKEEFAVFGLGLGYAVLGLFMLDEYKRLTIYEADFTILRMAFAINDFTEILKKGRIHFIVEETCQQIHKIIARHQESENTEIVLFYPAIRLVKDSKKRAMLEDYFVQHSSLKNQISLLKGNFKENQRHGHPSFSELKDHFSEKDVYIVAAGPSLDKNFMQLKDIKDGIILATGTVFKKLINAGIRPDYVIVSDANERVYAQIKDYETAGVPMLYLSTAYYGFAQKYEGEKYIVLQEEFPLAEEYAKQINSPLVKTGGSVSTTALSVSVVLGCKRIIFLGLDLAYTDNYVHASDTSRRNLTEDSDLRTIQDMYGNDVKTSKSMDLYRKWIEHYLSEHKEVSVYDATEGGAVIKGMQIVRLEDIIKND